ncbi:S8 family peptidase, partial [Aureispira]|nr:S8 family peptidase [Aureispira sp.]
QPFIQYVGEYFKNDKNHCLGILNQVIVQLNDISEYQLLEDIANEYKVKSIVPHRMKGLYELNFDKTSKFRVIDLAIKIHQSGVFKFAEPNYLMNPIVTTNDSLYNHQWAIHNTGSSMQYSGTIDADMDVQEAWTLTTGQPYIRVAILDSGVDTLHPDLISNLVSGYSAIGDSSKGYPSFNFSKDGHGTCCAGIVAAAGNNNIGTAGVAYSCKVIPIKTFYYQNIPGIGTLPYSTASWMADAITWSWQTGYADILSNSWGLQDLFIPLLPGPGDTSTVNAAVIQAYANGRNGKGSLLLFSSGNEGDPPIWPGREPDAISINATSMCDERKFNGSCDGESWEGNYGTGLELGAPGVKIATTDALGSNGFDTGDYEMTFNGTSAACPNAAGVMALILSVDSNLTAESARAIIDSTADKVGGYAYSTNSTYGTWSDELGYGRINAYSAVSAAINGSTSSSIDIQALDNIKIYPNPSQGSVFVSHHLENDRPIRLTLYSALGKLLLIKEISNMNQTELYLQNFPSGTYYLNLITEKSTVTKKLHLIR